MKRARIATYLANTLDHFDTSLYGFLVPILAPLFFPKNDPTIAIIQGYGIVIIGLLTRPLGAWYFSKKAQSIGAHKALVITIQGITLTTFCFVFLKGYDRWGIYGALALAGLRGFQSFFGAGETSIAGLYILEGTNSDQQHPIIAMYLSSQMAGIFFASLVASLIFYSEYPLLYWKWPFYGSLITGASAWWLRKQKLPSLRGAVETRQSSSIDSTHWIATPALQARKDGVWNYRDILRIAAVSGFSYVLYSASFLFFNSFANLLTLTPMTDMMASNTALMVFDIALLAIFGAAMRKANCKFLLKTIIILAVILMPLLFMWLPYLEFFGVCTSRVIMVTLGVAFCIPLHRWYWQEFPPNNRYKTTALGYAIGSETLGRTFPAVGLGLWYYTNSPIVPGLYIALIGVFAFLALCLPGQRQ